MNNIIQMKILKSNQDTHYKKLTFHLSESSPASHMIPQITTYQ